MLASLATILYLLRHKVSIPAHFVSGLAGLSSLTEAAADPAQTGLCLHSVLGARLAEVRKYLESLLISE